MRQPINRGRFGSMPLRERFDEKYTPEPNTGYWLWTAAINSSGYGSIGDQGRVREAHRVSYELHIGPIPEGQCVCHRCDMPCCVNPAHLFLGTHQENMDDRTRKGRSAVRLGAKNRSSKLKESDVISIRERYSRGGVSQRELGEEHGVSQAVISSVVLRQTWSHVP